MSQVRSIEEVLPARPTIEGAGVRLKRGFGLHEVPKFDPFLLMDEFHSEDQADYMAGFPWHPHRGMETVTYVIRGRVEHRDSMGNQGTIGPGDVQWMTAGSGIIHQEMPKPPDESGQADFKGIGHELWGLQLWVNLPAERKMMTPRYQEIPARSIPDAELENGVIVRVICGEVAGVRGPVTDLIVEPEYLDVTVPSGSTFTREVPRTHRVFAYVLAGGGQFTVNAERTVGPENVVLFGNGDEVLVAALHDPVRFLLVSGKPLNEPIAWEGPVVMNDRAQLEQAFREYRDGTFVKGVDAGPE